MSVIVHNMLAMNAQRQLGLNSSNKAKTTEKLSSGFRINRAADDASGLSISEKMRKQIRGLDQGVNNSQDGVSLCQVADGALSEVQDMLHRLTELSIKSANGTNSPSDRAAIQEEVDQIVTEINRIGNTTKFNEIYVFQGEPDIIKTLKNPDGTDAFESDIPFGDFTIADISIGLEPFESSTDFNHLNFAAKVNNSDSLFDGKTYRLIYGSGSTSNSSFRLNYTEPGGSPREVKVGAADLNFLSTDYDSSTGIWTRSYQYTNDDGVDLTVKQSVKATDGTAEKKYNVDYEITTNNPSIPASVEFMFHADTAYNNNDRCEGYFTDNSRIERNCIYTNGSDNLTNSVVSPYIHSGSGVPDSFSIVDVDNALAFSEKIALRGSGNERPTAVSIGAYSRIHDWDYYSSSNLSNNLGGSTNREDLGFSLYYEGEIGDGTTDGNSVKFSFDYGICATSSDSNISNVTLKSDRNPIITGIITREMKNIWIQSGAEAYDGIYMRMPRMNAKVLGIHDMDVTTVKSATESIDKVSYALERVSKHRSIIGAQQNRLEHTISNEKNIVENTQAAESLIRDANMANEMVSYSIQNILEQAGQNVLVQANQSKQGVLDLLSQ